MIPTLNWYGNTLCGNFRIFLPHRFYVKSNLSILGFQKTAILTFLVSQNLGILVTINAFKCEIISRGLKSKFRASKMTKIVIFELPKLPNLISRKIRVTLKSASPKLKFWQFLRSNFHKYWNIAHFAHFKIEIYLQNWQNRTF